MKRVAIFISVWALSGCVDDSRVFTQGRIEDLCNESIPLCGRQAACTLGNDEFFSSRFPGGQRVIVRTEFPDQTLNVRFQLDDLAFPGTELLVQAYSPDCGSYDEEHPRNIDLFELAGDDRIIEFNLDVPGRGDHLVEIFSDMSASYDMVLDLD
ncbi:MAG: hypothetical protein R3E66_09300 [bacterium]